MLWRTPAQDPGITVGRLEGDLGGRLYDKETGRNCQYDLTQQVEIASNWATPTAINHDESYYQRSGANVYPGLAKQVKESV